MRGEPQRNHTQRDPSPRGQSRWLHPLTQTRSNQEDSHENSENRESSKNLDQAGQPSQAGIVRARHAQTQKTGMDADSVSRGRAGHEGLAAAARAGAEDPGHPGTEDTPRGGPAPVLGTGAAALFRHADRTSLSARRVTSGSTSLEQLMHSPPNTCAATPTDTSRIAPDQGTQTGTKVGSTFAGR